MKRHPTAEPSAPCTFLVRRPDSTWTYCGEPAPSIWIGVARGFYRRCDPHQPSQYDRHVTAT